MVQHERASPNLNVFCAMSTRKVYDPFFFREDTATGTSYLEMQQDGAPLHFRLDVRHWLKDVLPHRWIGRDAREDLIFLSVACTIPRLNPL
jgi:hypothetical protein